MTTNTITEVGGRPAIDGPTLRLRCNQNKLFGCGQLVPCDTTLYVIGRDLIRLMGTARCSCGLPLAIVRNASRDEAEHYWGAL